MPKIMIGGFKCARCGHEWVSRPSGMVYKSDQPTICPKCKSPHWNWNKK